VDKKQLSETDIRTKFITPAIIGADGEKWDVMTQVREEYFFTRGRVIVRGKTVKRGEGKKADYLLFYKPDIPIAVVEAKDNTHGVGDGMQQALEYSKRKENEQAWRVSIDDIKASNFNLDIKNPHSSDTGPGDVDTLLPEYEDLLQLIAETRGKLKAQLESALMGKDVRGKDEG
jgi:hypothetical protein